MTIARSTPTAAQYERLDMLSSEGFIEIMRAFDINVAFKARIAAIKAQVAAYNGLGGPEKHFRKMLRDTYADRRAWNGEDRRLPAYGWKR